MARRRSALLRVKVRVPQQEGVFGCVTGGEILRPVSALRVAVRKQNTTTPHALSPRQPALWPLDSGAGLRYTLLYTGERASSVPIIRPPNHPSTYLD